MPGGGTLFQPLPTLSFTAGWLLFVRAAILMRPPLRAAANASPSSPAENCGSPFKISGRPRAREGYPRRNFCGPVGVAGPSWQYPGRPQSWTCLDSQESPHQRFSCPDRVHDQSARSPISADRPMQLSPLVATSSTNSACPARRGRAITPPNCPDITAAPNRPAPAKCPDIAVSEVSRS